MLAFVLAHFATEKAMSVESHPYVGMWVTADGYVRHELLPNGRYDEARGTRESAYQGRYEVIGDHIQYWDDTGFTADGVFIDGVLRHAGMTLRRREDGSR
ncbi:Atu4866 domain-containing protein [Salinarimonas ramus]|uniref:Atu4866 domain-containing protein n=1 Tax=Salinarimonas ramus TaxID=690164 RepID=UPI001664DE2A|nr:Atu4866 domain-containing protein [Salinarimonas ramus]